MSVHVPASVPKHMRAGVRDMLSDRDRFVGILKIKHKQEQKFVPFTPNPAQQRLWEVMDSSNRVIVLKARQLGVSTAVRAWQFHRAYCATTPETFAVLSFHDRSAKNLRRLDRRWLTDLPRLLQREYEVDTASDTVFKDTLAGVSSFTTGGRGGTRSFEFSGAHLSEFAFYTDPDEVLAQSLSTVGDGPLIIESTVNAPGDAFHRLIEGAPENGWTVFTYWWWQHEPYRDDAIPLDWVRTPEEEELAERYDLDDAQLVWRRKQVATLGETKFRREYPACMDDAFLSREHTYFDSEDLDAIEQVWFDDSRRQLEEPRHGCHYVMGVDVGGGVGQDYSTMVVISLDDLQPVYIERANTVSPAEWGQRVTLTAQRYNNALVLCESNNHGHVVLREMASLRYKRVWLDGNGKPWVTSVKTKLEAYAALNEVVRSRILAVLDQSTLMELRALWIPPGKVTPEAPSGMHDDLAMALALAYRCVRSAPQSQQREAKQHVMDEFIRARRVAKIKSRALPWSPNT